MNALTKNIATIESELTKSGDALLKIIAEDYVCNSNKYRSAEEALETQIMVMQFSEDYASKMELIANSTDHDLKIIDMLMRELYEDQESVEESDIEFGIEKGSCMYH